MAGAPHAVPLRSPPANHRWVSAAVALLGCFLGLSGSVGPAAAQDAASWSSFQGGAAHLGFAPGIRPGFRVAWRIAPTGDARLSAPAVAPGLAVSVGSGIVIGFDPSTGAQLWTVPRARGPIVPPAVDPTAGEHGVVVYTEGADLKTGALVAIDASTRERLWRVLMGDVSRSAPAVRGGRAFVGSRNRLVQAVDVATGKVVWKARARGQVDAAVAVDGKRVYVVSQNLASGRGALEALSVETGKILWSFAPSRLPTTTTAPTVAAGTVYVGCGDATVRAIDAATGAERWSEPVRGEFSPLSSPAFSDGRLYLVDREGGLYSFEAATGRRAWDYQFDETADWAAPLVSDGSVAVALDDGTVGSVDTRTGHLVWEATLGLGPLGALGAVGDLLLVPSIGTRGGVTAFGHDPSFALLDRSSPTELKLGPALLNYAGAFALIVVLLAVVFGRLARRRQGPVFPDAPRPGWSPRGGRNEVSRP
jgi:outer membrane protein assembly factor BamB